MNQTASTAPVKKKRRLGLFQLAIVIGFFTLVWFSFGQNVLAPQQPAGAPEQFGGLRLVSSTSGPPAMARINQLHGTEIVMVSAYVAEYSLSYSERVTVWVGQAASRDAAGELLDRMITAIARGGTGFSSPQTLSVTGHDIFRVAGPGGEHYFYLSPEPGSRVIWLTITAGDSQPILEQAVKTF